MVLFKNKKKLLQQKSQQKNLFNFLLLNAGIESVSFSFCMTTETRNGKIWMDIRKMFCESIISGGGVRSQKLERNKSATLLPSAAIGWTGKT